MAFQKWTVKSCGGQIADTGDYDYHAELSNGRELLYDADNDTESLQQIADILNENEIELYSDDSNEFVLHHEKTELKKALKALVEASDNNFDQMDTDCRACTDGLTIVEVALVKAQKLLKDAA